MKQETFLSLVKVAGSGEENTGWELRDVLIPARPEHPASPDLTPVCRVEPPISGLSGLVCLQASTLLPRAEVRGLCLWASQPHERSALRTRSRRKPKAGQGSGVGAKRVSGKHWREAPLLCEGDPDFSHIPQACGTHHSKTAERCLRGTCLWRKRAPQTNQQHFSSFRIILLSVG